MQAMNNKPYIVKRPSEVARLVNFLESKTGGSLLVGGDRGSGKTTVVREAIDRVVANTEVSRGPLKFIKSLRKFTLSRVIYIDIPLIIVNQKQEELSEREMSEAYRSMLMRAIVTGFIADQQKRYDKYYWWFGIPQKLFRAVGYTKKLKSMKAFANYVNMSKSITRVLSVPTITSSPSIQHAITAELDLSDVNLEIRLRDLLSQFSRVHNFIIVFDELDKLPEVVKLEDIVMLMKNLFSETGAHAIYITDETTLKRVKTASKKLPASEMTTLFIDHMLLNSLSLVQFEEVIQKYVNNIDKESYEEFFAAINLRTGRSPFEFKRLLTQYGSNFEDIKRGLKVELGTIKYERQGVMQLFVDFTYSLFSGRYDEYFDRVLKSTLQDAGSIISENQSNFFNFYTPSYLFYTSRNFAGSGISNSQAKINEKLFKNDEEIPEPGIAPDSPEQINNMNELLPDQKRDIENSLEALIVLLNRTGYLPLTLTDKQNVINMLPLIINNFNYKSVNSDDFKTVFDLSSKENSTLNTIEIYEDAYDTISGSELLGSIPRTVDRANLSDFNSYGKFSLANIRPLWEKLHKIASTARESTLQAIADAVQTAVPTLALTTSQVHNQIVIKLPTEKTLKIIALFKAQRPNPLPRVNKTFILRDPKSTGRRGDTRSDTKNINMQDKWKYFPRALSEIADWISSN